MHMGVDMANSKLHDIKKKKNYTLLFLLLALVVLVFATSIIKLLH